MRQTITIISLVTAALGCEGDRGPPGEPGGFDPEAPALDKAFAGAGGRDALVALAGYTKHASGERLMALEGFHPEDDANPVSTFTADIATDVAGDRLRIDYHRTIPLFGAMTDYAVILDGDVGVVDGVESVFGIPGGDLTSDRWAATRKQQRLLDPQLILRDLALGTLTASDGGIAIRDGELRQRLEIADAVHPISLFVDRYTGELTDVETLENDFVRGDLVLAAHYLGWRTWDGDVKFPSDVAITLAGDPVHLEHRDAITLAAPDPAAFALPAGAAPAFDPDAADRGARNGQFHESFAALGVPLDGLQTAVEPQQLAPGVFHLRGGTHNSLVIEQQDGIVVVEAPLYEPRAQALYAWIATQLPGKPVTHVIATHHHRDHTGSLRTFVARGARVVLGAASKPFFTRAFVAAHTLVPDELAGAPAAAAFSVVPEGGTLTLPDPQRPVQVVAVATTHAADMVIAYVPSAKVVFVSDIYSPGLPPNPFGARELLGAITGHGLAVDTLAGGHGGVGPRADLDAIAGM